jgi:bacterioferritin
MSKKLIDALNKGRARELRVAIEYMRQHYLAEGMESPPFVDLIKQIAITEMKHAEAFAERIVYLGGEPTIKPDPIQTQDTLKAMIESDLQTEEEAIALYKSTIKLAREESDPTTRTLVESILAEEEEHRDQFLTLLGKKGK